MQLQPRHDGKKIPQPVAHCRQSALGLQRAAEALAARHGGTGAQSATRSFLSLCGGAGGTRARGVALLLLLLLPAPGQRVNVAAGPLNSRWWARSR